MIVFNSFVLNVIAITRDPTALTSIEDLLEMGCQRPFYMSEKVSNMKFFEFYPIAVNISFKKIANIFRPGGINITSKSKFNN